MSILYIGNFPKQFELSAKEFKVSLISVKNSMEAIQLLKENKTINVIISQYNLPGNTGLFLFEQAQEITGLNSIPFILVTNEFNEVVYNKAFKKGINDYFVFSNNNVKEIIAKAISIGQLKNSLSDNAETIYDTKPYKMPRSKRLFDVLFASLILLLVSPFLLIIMLAIRIESKGKVYYIAKRVGRNAFDFYKLRSMKTGSDALLKNLAKKNNQYNQEQIKSEVNFKLPCPKCSSLKLMDSCSPLLYIGEDKICDYWYNFQKNEIKNSTARFIKITNDPRVTRVGKFIRNTSIDELPQLINVLKGDMSIVGNRPLPLYEAELLTQDKLSQRFLAPAGITGLWQVELRGKCGIMSEDERMQLDREYVNQFSGNNYSLWYDIKIILKTIPALLQKSAV